MDGGVGWTGRGPDRIAMRPYRTPPAPTFRGAAAAVDGLWPASESAAEEGADIERVVRDVGGLEVADAPSLSAPMAGLALAVVGARGGLLCADPPFPALADGGAAASVRDLLRRAAQGEPAIGLVETDAGGVVALCAASPARAAAWPLSQALRAALAGPGRLWVLMAFAPARASTLARHAAATFGLSDLESRVAAAMVEVPTLEIAASRVGVGRATARDALQGAMHKMGEARIPALVRRLTDLMCGSPRAAETDDAVFATALNLTPAEARVAQLSAQGATANSVAETLGVKPETVKSHLRSAFGKTGLGRAKDLGRIDVELKALKALSQADEILAQADDLGGRLRLIVQADGRRVAFIDHGPPEGRLVLVCHALASGRRLTPALTRKLQAGGYRPVVPQRPGYGLTDPTQGDYLATAAEDMAAILRALKRARADVFARDIAAAPLLAFAERFPDRIGQGVLLNPQRPIDQPPEHQGGRRYAISAASRLLHRHPEITESFFEVLRRQTGTDRLAAILRASFKSGAPSDIAGLDDPELVHWMVRDIQAMVAHTTKGIVRERLAYSNGWRPPARVGGLAWTVAHCAELNVLNPQEWWADLPNARFEQVAEGGLLLPLTHPDAVVRLLKPDHRGPPHGKSGPAPTDPPESSCVPKAQISASSA